MARHPRDGDGHRPAIRPPYPARVRPALVPPRLTGRRRARPRDLEPGTDRTHLSSHPLLTGAAIWLTNVLVFAFWYWDLDGGGPAQRAIGAGGYPAFLFAQMQSPEVAPDDWKPTFVDYLYLSFTNATAFSPTDVLPLARWAKLTMMLQSLVSLSTVALVIARAVNILK